MDRSSKSFNKILNHLVLSFLTTALLILPTLPNMTYLGTSTWPFIQFILQEHTQLAIFVASQTALFVLTLMIVFLVIGWRIALLPRILCYLTFLLFVMLRFALLYPAAASQWLMFREIMFFEKILQIITRWPTNTLLRNTILVLPIAPFTILLILGFTYLFRDFAKTRHLSLGQYFDKTKIQNHTISKIELVTQSLCFLSLSYLMIKILTSYNDVNFPLAPKVSIDSKVRSPDVFLLTIDSLRVDRIQNSKYQNVMPFLQKKQSEALVTTSFLVGVPRTFSSWTDIITGRSLLTHQLRNMFPSQKQRLNLEPTLYSILKEQGYQISIVSDFAGDIFPRLLKEDVDLATPNSNLLTLIQNTLISAIAPLQSFLAYPMLAFVFDGFLENPDIADPKILTYWLNSKLKDSKKENSPIFKTLFFSSAHFPYAAPSPWVSKFQSNAGKVVFKKNPNLKQSEFGRLVPTEEKELVQALYDGGLASIDSEIEHIFKELEHKGWLKNAVIVVFGDHGENLYDGSGELGMGHGDGVAGEYSTQTPFIVWRFLDDKAIKMNVENLDSTPKLMKSIDVTPTLLDLLNLKDKVTEMEGKSIFIKSTPQNIFEPTKPETTSLSDVCVRQSNNLKNRAYQESGLWFSQGNISPEGAKRISYPDIIDLVQVDPFHNEEFVLKKEWSGATLNSKERAWVTEKYRLVARTSDEGTTFSLYNRYSDPFSKNNLLLNDFASDAKIQAEILKQELTSYLKCRGITYIPLDAERGFFYDPSF